MFSNIEVIWLQINLPHLKPILVGSCYKPPSANSQYLDNLCECLIMYVIVTNLFGPAV